MHRPPAVSFSAGRSRWHLRCILFLFVSAAVVFWAFAVGQPQSDWQAVAVACTLLAAALWALFGWYQSPQGTLSWNGEQWHWSGYSDQPACILSLRMDWQRSLLVSLQRRGKPTDWLWLDAGSDAVSWRAFRRAACSIQSGFPEDDGVQTSRSHGEVV